LAKRDGVYGEFPSIFQEYVELPKDAQGDYYQAGGIFGILRVWSLDLKRGGFNLEYILNLVGHIGEDYVA